MKLIALMTVILSAGIGNACKTTSNSDTKASTDNEAEKIEFTGSDAASLIKSFKQLGLKSEPKEPEPKDTIKIAKIVCIKNSRGPTSCKMTQDGRDVPSSPENTDIYELFKKNGVKEEVNVGNLGFTLTDVECVTYESTRGTSKCFYRQEAVEAKMDKSIDQRTEFTGPDAGSLIDKFKTLGLKSVTSAAGEQESIKVSQITCKTESTGATLCSLTQNGKRFNTTASDKSIYSLFKSNGVREGGTPPSLTMTLTDVECVNYLTYRGTSKCFFKNTAK